MTTGARLEPKAHHLTAHRPMTGQTSGAAKRTLVSTGDASAIGLWLS